jgi:NifU-like protein involved in Fe-S cluster formation
MIKKEGQDWFYTNEVKKHFFSPKNFLKKGEDTKKYNGYGKVGNVKCGDMMEMWLLIKNNKIKKCRWKTFGCASAIASTSILSEMITKNGGLEIEAAEKITPQEIVKNLNGLPSIKFHCSVLGDQALRDAIKNYKENIIESKKVIKTKKKKI